MKKLIFNKIFLSVVFGLLFLIYSLVTISDYNIMWDGRTHFIKGQAFANFFLSGKKDYSGLPITVDYLRYYNDYAKFFTKLDVDKRLSKDTNYRRSIYQDEVHTFNWYVKNKVFEHPVLSDIGSAFSNIIFYEKLGIVRDDHAYELFGIFLASILVGVVFLWSSGVYGIFTGLITTIVLITTPLFLAESHYNIKDIPLLSFFSLCVFSFWWAVKKYSLKWMFVSAILGGLALGTKFNALFIPVILFLWFFLHVAFTDKASRKKYVKWWWVLPVFPLIMFAVLTAGWPQMWNDPIGGFFSILSYYKTVGLNVDYTPTFRTIFNISTYPSVWIFYTTYPLVLFLAILGVVGWIKNLRKTKDILPLLFLIWFLIPLSRASLPNTSIFGGVRHIMEYITPLSMLAGYGAYFLVGFVSVRWKRVTQALILIAFIPFIITLIKLHPAENVYFNSFIGGLSGAKSSSLTGWGNTDGGIYKEAVNWLNKNAEKNSHIAVGFSETADFYIPEFRQDLLPDNQFSGYLQKGEYIVALTHDSGLEETYRMLYPNTFLTPLYEYKVDGVSLIKIWKNDKKYLKNDVKSLISEKISSTPRKDGFILKWDLGRVYKLNLLELQFNKTSNCSSSDTAYIQISQDGNNWTVVPETYPTTVIDDLWLKQQDNTLVAPIAALNARYIWLVADSENSCMLSYKSNDMTILK